MVSSDADEELLFNIPFTGNIKLKGMIIMGGSQGHHPSKVKLFKNRPHMTFDDAQSKCDQVRTQNFLIVFCFIDLPNVLSQNLPKL